MIHIPTHDSHIFNYFVIYLLCTGSFYITYKVQTKLHVKNFTYLGRLYSTGLFVDILIIAFGFYLQPNLIFILFKFNTDGFVTIVSLMGLIFGIAYVKFEELLYRTPKYFDQNKGSLSTGMLVIVTTIGILEEIMFRGFLSEISLLNNGKIELVLIFFGTIAFGLSHLFISWVQFFSKTLFSISMISLYFITGSILAPILAHASFNYLIAKKYPQELYDDCYNPI